MYNAVKEIFSNIKLLVSLVKREISLKYKGSIGGSAWAILMPLCMLVIYTFVFSHIFKAKWGAQGYDAPKSEFALILFIGIIAYNFFSECITRSPTIITSNPNYVKKVVFPLGILPIVYVLSAFFNMVLTIFIWLVGYIVISGMPHLTLIYLPLVILPLLIFSLGTSYLLASLGTYIKDINQLTGLIATALMFLSPIFYPISAIPEAFRSIMQINPLTPAVEEMRSVMYFGNSISWELFLKSLLISVVFFILSFVFYSKTKKGFADVL